MNRVDHIGIAVNDINKSNKLFAKILGKDNFETEIVDSEGVITSSFELGDSKIELIASVDSKSPIAKYLTKRKEGVHHIALYVLDIKKEMDRLRKEGIRLLNDVPKKGADNKLICFLNPKDTNGVLIEMCQNIII